MDSLALIGSILLLAGFLLFSLRLMAYNRRKFGIPDNGPSDSLRTYLAPHNLMRILTIIIFLIALIILVLGS